MKTERVVISFIAVLVGILAAGLAFYFYQSTKTIPSTKPKIITIATPTPIQKSSIFLTIDQPEDESVVNSKTITISGKTIPDATIIISSDSSDQIITPATTGAFSTTQIIDSDQNKIEITAIAPNGEEAKITKVVTFSSENF